MVAQKRGTVDVSLPSFELGPACPANGLPPRVKKPRERWSRSIFTARRRRDDGATMVRRQVGGVNDSRG